MKLPEQLQAATLLRRYKRFLADIELADGSQLTIHCPNTGSMKNCQQAGSRVWYTLSDNPKRKYPGTWQLIEVDKKHLVGINTGLANKLVREAIESQRVGSLTSFDAIRSEVPYGEQRSRIDLLLQAEGKPPCYIEVKNVSLGQADGQGLFPDAVTQRGQKHLQELMEMVRQGNRAVLCFCVQHSGIDRLSPADEIDPDYADLLRQASAAGVELIALRASFDVQASEISLTEEIPVCL
ncbi:MAG: DNA/RNA nuclease SfsA [Pseudomonadales bacterium]|nr:DNA/RNA nuclease SfsA [Pseudomonadales bacterium]